MSQEVPQTEKCHTCTHHGEKHHHHHDQKFTNEKSLVVLDVKPIGVETNLQKIRDYIVANIQSDGLAWGESRIEEVAFGLKKLVIGGVVKDKVSVQEIVEKISKVQGVQDVDVASFNKV